MGIRPELDKFEGEAILRAKAGVCDGSCEEHRGEVRAVRIFHPVSKTDWGYFSYCEEALETDKDRGGLHGPREGNQ